MTGSARAVKIVSPCGGELLAFGVQMSEMAVAG